MLAIGSIMLPSFASHPDGHQDHSDVNVCEGKQPVDGTLTNADHTVAGVMDGYWNNRACEEMIDTGYNVALPQAGMDVTKDGDYGDMADPTGAGGIFHPIMGDYAKATPPLCPVNVHWHLGAEHRSAGEFDENGVGPDETSSASSDDSSATMDDSASSASSDDGSSRRLGENVRRGFRCHHYDAADPKFTTPFDWQTCTNMVVGETYEIHWPHSAAGACGTNWQYQTPFYDGVFCNDGIITIAPLNTYEKIGVQGQIFTIVNDEAYYYPNLIDGMLTGGDFAKTENMAMYTGSTTGTSRDNEICSRYTPITWQVDRKCHLISASSFDKLCADMMTKADDMSGDVYPHGARELVATHLAADNQQN